MMYVILLQQRGANYDSTRGVPLIWGNINLALLAFIVIGTWIKLRYDKKHPPIPRKRGRPRKDNKKSKDENTSLFGSKI